MAQNHATGFLANAGQMKNTDGTVNNNLLFSGQIRNAKVYITKTAISLVYFQQAPDSTKKDSIYRMDIAFKNPNAGVTVTGQDISSSYSNYFIGLLRKKDVKEYGKITLANIWPNISLELTSTENEFKLKYLLAVGANPNDIQLQFNGGNNFIYANGNLSFNVPFGNSLTTSKFNWTTPTSVQSATPAANVSSSFNSTTKTFQVIASNYQSAFASSIQQNIPTTPVGPIGGTSYPILKWGTYYGGSKNDEVKDVYISPSNFIYVLGTTESLNFPQILNVIQDDLSKASDMFVAKFNPDRSRVFSTYFGSDDNFDYAGGIAVNTRNEIYFCGSTTSKRYPYQPYSFTYNAIDKINSNLTSDLDGVISKLSTDGQSILWSSYFSSSGIDRANDIAIDKQDNVYIVGNSNASDLSIKASTIGFNQAFNPCNLTSGVSYIAKFNKFDTLVSSTFYGGCSGDNILSCTVDNFNNLIIYGAAYSQGTVNACNTSSSMLICGVPGSYQQNFAGATDTYIAKFNQQGQITWSTFYGGNQNDRSGIQGSDIITDLLGDIYITGYTNGNFPVTPLTNNQTVYGGGLSDGFVVRFSSTGVRKWASYLGGLQNDEGRSISIVNNGFLVAGNTTGSFPYKASTGFLNDNSFNGGIWDNFLTQYSSTNDLMSSSYLGGMQKDFNPKISSSDYKVVIGGKTESTNFIVRKLGNASYYDDSFNGISDGYIMNLNIDPDPCNVYPIGCRVSGIAENEANKLFSIYPNPALGLVTIKFTSQFNIKKDLVVYDSFGKLIFKQILSSEQENISIDLTNFSKGLYLIQLISEAEVSTQKLIVQ